MRSYGVLTTWLRQAEVPGAATPGTFLMEMTRLFGDAQELDASVQRA